MQNITVVAVGPHHNYHICKNDQCRSVLQIDRLEHKHFPSKLMSVSLSSSESVYSTPSNSQGYTCPQCGDFNDLWVHLGEYTSADLEELAHSAESKVCKATNTN